MPWAARAGVDPRRGSFFVHNNMGNLILGRDDAPAAKTEFRGIWRNRSSQTCSGDLAWPEFGAATFVNVGRGCTDGVICSQVVRRIPKKYSA